MAVERFAAEYLEQQGLRILHRNFRCRFGEIDLIAKHDSILVFVEVRFRKNKHFGGPLASIDHRKQQKIIRTAHFFLNSQPRYQDTPCRFDALAITLCNLKPDLEWIQNAFQAF